MKNSKDKWIKRIVMAATLPVLATQAETVTVEAAKCGTEQECAELIQDAQQEIESIEKETEEKEESLTEVEKDIDELMIQIEETQTKIKKTQHEIKTTNQEIKQSEQALKELNGEISDLKETVGVRMRISQRMSRSNMVLNWLSESSSLADLLRSLQVINHFASNDASQMEDLKALLAEQTELMNQLKEQQVKLESAKQTLEKSQDQLEKDQAALERQREKVKKEIQALESEKLSAQEAQKIAEEQKAFLEKLAAEEEKRRQEEEEKKKQEALLQQQQQQESNNDSQGDSAGEDKEEGSTSTDSNQNNSNSDSSDSGSSSVIPSSSTFRIPLATGYVSCEFMCYPGHNGIDLGNRGDTSTPVLATASGIVTRSGWHSAYGNHVMITHQVNGKVYTTVYAHMHTRPYVSVGQTVSQGQQIGTMGNTGNSFGAHLHFELYEGYYNYPYSVNPRKYINFPSRW